MQTVWMSLLFGEDERWLKSKTTRYGKSSHSRSPSTFHFEKEKDWITNENRIQITNEDCLIPSFEFLRYLIFVSGVETFFSVGHQSS